MLEFATFIFGFAGFAAAVFAIIKSAKAGQKSIDNAEKLVALNDNHLEHHKEWINDLKVGMEKLSRKIDHNEASVNKLYTEIAKIDTRCKSNHK